MNILFVTSAYPSREKPHYCIYLEQQAQALQALGNHVEILFLTQNTNTGRYTQNGLPVCELGLEHAWLEKFAVLRKTRRRLSGFPWQQFDVVSLHFGRLSHMNAIADICRKRKIKVVRHFHGLNVWKEYLPSATAVHRIYEAYLTTRKKRLLRHCSAVVGVSNLVCAQVLAGMRLEQIHTVYNGVDLQRFSPLTEKPQSEEFRLLCVANLIPLKGQQYLLEAVQALRDSRKLRLTLIGEGPERGQLEQRCQELGIAELVEFLGAQDYTVVSRYMQNSDMFIMPSCYEAFGCVFVEAMSSGLLTCGCKGTGAEEIISDGVDGLLLEQKNPASIVEAICFAMDNREQALEIAARGRVKAAEFSWDRSARTLQEVYTAVCEKK